VNIARAHLVSIGSFFNFSDRSFVRIQRSDTIAFQELEQEHKRIYGQMGDPAFYKDSGKNITNARIDEIDKELKEAYRRWEELEEIKEASGNS